MPGATLTDLIPIMFSSLPSFNREMTGFLPSVTMYPEASKASVHDTVRFPSSTVEEPQDITPGLTPPQNRGDTEYDKVDFKIEVSESIMIKLDGEEDLAIENSGNYDRIMKSRFENGFRKLANKMERYIADKVVKSASRAYGTPGTTPFGTAGNLLDLAKLAQILDDNGAPIDGRNLVLNSTAFANMRGVQTILLKANEAGTDEFLRTGYTNPVSGFHLWNSAGISRHAKGTGTGYALATDYKKGDNVLSVDTGSGTVLEGDIVTFAGDENKYVINKGTDAAGAITIGKPGLWVPSAKGTAMTIGDDYYPCVAFQREAVAFATRVPAVPKGGDMAKDETLLYDEKSGVTFSVRLYPGYHESRIEIGIAYGGAVLQPENVALLLG